MYYLISRNKHFLWVIRENLHFWDKNQAFLSHYLKKTAYDQAANLITWRVPTCAYLQVYSIINEDNLAETFFVLSCTGHAKVTGWQRTKEIVKKIIVLQEYKQILNRLE
ncbi:hypothetical protein BP422_25100 [Brevibacillus formosus]|uniref:Uncharacterized protein n=1 Tax=Brevibacillus formosus TaxID=54913 RepID=A0A220MNA6_9BACL|nr:hypothetical protein BP422_25100 [Brevibacillus formosus]